MSKKIIGTLYRDTVTGNEWIERDNKKKSVEILWEIVSDEENNRIKLICPHCGRCTLIIDGTTTFNFEKHQVVLSKRVYCGYCGHKNILNMDNLNLNKLKW